MSKCGVCGSENEAAALFCGTCGSVLTPGEAKAIADDAAATTITETPAHDESVVPGKGGARRDLGTGGETTTVPDADAKAGAGPEEISDVDTTPGSETITCGVCSTVNDATRTYCRKCANELKAAPPPPPPPPPPTPKPGISPLAIGLGAAAVVVAVALIGVLVMGGGTPGATLGPTAKASTVPTQPGVVPTAAPTVIPTVTAPPRTFTEGALSGKIVFARCPAGGGDCAIYIRPANSSAKAERVIGATSGSALDPSLSYSGKKILYVVNGGLNLATISTREFVKHSSTPGDTNPDWSSDDQQITFAGHRDRESSGDDLEIRIDGIGSSSSSRAVALNDVIDHDPVFTPDGKSIVFIQGEGDGRELKMINIASGEVTDITTDAFADEDPAVSPDGTEVVFASKRGDGSEYDLFVLNLATLQITALPTMSGNEHDPAWSPGGRYIVFSGGAGGSEDLFILDRADMTTTPFTTAEGGDLTPSWR